ncbi:MAG TPA: protein kinase [Gemmataceae bacterium]|nr:protein kinase [Gemmataceae bacterium]
MTMMATSLTSHFSLSRGLYPGYELRRMRGRGGFGEVWEAETDDGRPVALKFVSCARGRGAPQELRSIQMMRQLVHPQLTRVDKVWCAPGFLVIAMELADGSLADLLEVYRSELGTALPADHLCPLLTQAAEALDFLNLRQHLVQDQWMTIQHCDVTPPNLLLFDQTVKLSDFGLTTALAFRDKAHFRAGTPAYAAPEVFQGRVSDRTDQYALAVCYCLLRGGQLPFPNTPTDFPLGYVRPAPDLSMLTLAERTIVGRALSPVPQDRWSSCGELISELRRLTHPAWASSQAAEIERRTEPRYPAGAAMACAVLATQGNGAWAAEVQNLSAGGVRLRIVRPGCVLRPGRILDVALSNAARGVCVVQGLRLTNCTERKGGDYEVGGSFDRPLQPNELKALSEGNSATAAASA